MVIKIVNPSVTPPQPLAKTAKATAARVAGYDATIKTALPSVQAAREAGAKCANEFAKFLNDHDIPAPNGGSWSSYAVIRCLRRLKALGLDPGSLTPQQAKQHKTHHAKKMGLELYALENLTQEMKVE